MVKKKTQKKKIEILPRPGWDETFMMMAKIMAQRTACRHHKIAAVFVDEDHKIVATGYNGPTVGDVHCNVVGCAKIDGDPITGELKRCRGAHSEINAIMNAGNPMRLKNSTLYVTSSPCYDCMKSLNNIGVQRIVYYEEYSRIKDGGKSRIREDEVWELAKKRKIKLEKFKGSLDFFKDTLMAVSAETGSPCSSCK